MLRLSKDHCLGNKWLAIELEPVDTAYFLPILLHFSQAYHFAWPQIMDDIDGYTAFFMINHSVALMLLDTWTFSIAFGVEAVHGQVFADLSALSPDYFGV